MLSAGVLLARQGRVAEAELQFLATQSLFPSSAAPLRERAGLRFLAEDWKGASRLAETSLALDPNDAHTWRLLATSRFLAGDVEGALGAWNCVSEPRIDLTHIDGLTHLRYSAVTDQIQLPPGQLLTPRAFRRASRRLADMPAQLESRLSLRPVPDGKVQVNVALVERPPVPGDLWGLARTSLAALVGREVVLDVTNLTGNGEVWTAGWRWWEDRPRVSLTLRAPAGGGRPGIWLLDTFWERQTYEGWTPPDSEDTSFAKPVVEERRRTALSFSDWFGPDLRLEVGAALDEWTDRGSHLSLQTAIETRWARDRVALTTQLARWNDLGKGPAFSAGLLSAQWSSTGLGTAGPWQGILEVSTATSEAPLAIWPGAGTGYGRTPLLRAHPLLDGGVIQSSGVFGRTLLHGTLERRAHSWSLGGLRIGWVLFMDGARPWQTGRTHPAPWQVDGGTGLRLQGLGTNGQLRIDAAVGLDDGSSAISLGWQIPSY